MSTQRQIPVVEPKSSPTRSSANTNNAPAAVNVIEQSSNLHESNEGLLRYLNPNLKLPLPQLINFLDALFPRVIWNTRNNSTDRGILLTKVMVPLIVAQAIVSPSDTVLVFDQITKSVIDDSQLFKLVLRLVLYIQNKSYKQFFRLIPHLETYFAQTSRTADLTGQWAEGVCNLSTELRRTIINASLKDISRAYTSINIDEIEVGYDVENLLPILMRLKWNYDEKTRLAYPFKNPTNYSTTRRK